MLAVVLLTILILPWYFDRKNLQLTKLINFYENIMKLLMVWDKKKNILGTKSITWMRLHFSSCILKNKWIRTFILIGKLKLDSFWYDAIQYLCYCCLLLLQVGNVSVSCARIPLLALEYEPPRLQANLLEFSA